MKKIKENRKHVGEVLSFAKNGITLVALVITVIILLILAGITIRLTIGQEGILQRAEEAGKNYQEEAKKEDKIVTNLLEKIEGIISLEVKMSYVGTSSFTMHMNASSKQGKIVKYKYKINEEEEKETIQNSVTIDNLMPETEYTIIVHVEDDKGNMKTSEPVKIITKKRTYIVKDGVPQVTGTSNGHATTETKSGYFQIITSRTNGYYRPSYGFLYDLSSYKKVKIDLEIPTKTALPALCIFLANSMTEAMESTDVYQGEDKIRELLGGSLTSVERKLYSYSIEKVKGKYYITFYQNMEIGSTTWNIYNLWLEE